MEKNAEIREDITPKECNDEKQASPTTVEELDNAHTTRRTINEVENKLKTTRRVIKRNKEGVITIE